MRIKLLAVGTRMPDWVEAGVNEYRKRLPAEFSLEIQEIALAKRGKNPDIKRAKAQEAQALLKAVAKDDVLVALDVTGRAISTDMLAKTLNEWHMDGRNLSLLVGGPDGLDDVCLKQARERWSLSAMTLPHPLVRVMLAEQIYRAWSILQGHPYHR
ncbi:23S rRNA (pseudouridine(1915)-N(3))-methyltransferase RlmH [Litorivivens sp.]|uniref:23S rRNA (pseudouridine(1915)-N(3))-methyltransferase RlmH n=1 Tax=Litorivivens sp. TaxID=2020868 RepID=UPI003569E868